VRSDRERLLDLLDATDRIAVRVARGRERFDADEDAQLAMVRLIEIVGEACASVSAGTHSRRVRRELPEAPEPAIPPVVHAVRRQPLAESVARQVRAAPAPRRDADVNQRPHLRRRQHGAELGGRGRPVPDGEQLDDGRGFRHEAPSASASQASSACDCSAWTARSCASRALTAS
jgi:hypothetical protein